MAETLPEPLPELAESLAQTIAGQYRLDADAAHALVWATWAADTALHRQAAAAPDSRRLTRTRAYKQAAKRAKAAAYQRLRRYRQDEAGLAAATQTLADAAETGAGIDSPDVDAARAAILAGHVSTAERGDAPEALYREILSAAGPVRHILDIGAGVAPLAFPFAGAGADLATLLALDRDEAAVAAVAAWARLAAPDRLVARRWSLADGFAAVTAPDSAPWDLAIAAKLVPVLARQDRRALATLTSVPARRLAITGATAAMAKRTSIARREARVLRDFAEEVGAPVLAEISLPGEVGLILDLTAGRDGMA